MAKKDLILIVGVDDKGTPIIKGMARQVGGELQKLDKKARTTGKGFNKLKDDVDKSASGMSKFKSILKSTAIQMAAGMGVMIGVQSAVRGLKNVVTDFIKTGREFEKSWANVTTMLSISEQATLKMKNELIGLSPTLGGVTEMAKGMYQVLSASIEPAKAIEFLGTAAKAAVAGVTDVFTAVDALTTVINAYGMAAEDATMVSDIMFQTVKRGKLTFGELSSALGTVVPTAAQLGIRFEEIAAGMATLTRQGINVNTVTMQLRQVMMSVLKPTSEAIQLAEDLGIEFTATALRAKGLSKFLEEIAEKTKGNVTMMGEFFSNIRALSAVFGLAGSAAADFAYDISLMESSIGSTEVAFQKQMKTLDFWIGTAKNALEDIKVAFYEGMVDPIRAAISSQEDLDRVFESMTGTAETTGKAVGSILKLFKVIQPMIDQWLETTANAEVGFARIIQFITMGYVPAYDKLLQKQWEALVTSGRLGKSEKSLGENMKGIWGVLVRGAVVWQNQVDFYINSGLAVDEYLKKLQKLWRGQSLFQKQSAQLAAMSALDLKTKKELRGELAVLQGNILQVLSIDKAYTNQLETHIKKAMALAKITGDDLAPAIKQAALELGLLDKQTKEYLETLKGVRTGTEWWNYEVVSGNKIMQNAQTELAKYAYAWGVVNLQLRERNKLFLEKYAITPPAPMTDPYLTKLEQFSVNFLAVLDKIRNYGGMVAQQWDATWNQAYQNSLQRIDNEYQARKQAIDDSMDSDQQKYFAIEKLDREMQKKRLAAQRKHAKASKLTSLFAATVSTAEAVAKALTAGPFLGPILAAVIGALGAAQIAMIASAPLPSFAKGGIAGLHGPEVVMVGEEGPERITPIKDERPRAGVSPITTGGDKSVTFQVSYYITSPDALGVRDFIRDKAGPEFINWVKLNKTDMIEALDMG